jgi:NADH dehydrogenase FAD-containing subunit
LWAAALEVVAAESLARKLGREHQIVLVSRSRKFLFYPALVRLAFGRGEPDDVSFDLREAMLDRRITFIEGEIARIHPGDRHVTIARGEFTGQMHYDYLTSPPKSNMADSGPGPSAATNSIR